MRRYETIFITHPDLTEEEFTELQGKINGILAHYQGDLIKFDDWGIRKLTFEIRKNHRGRFFLVDYAAGTDLIRELERNLRLHDRVLRFQTVRIGDQVTPEAIQAWKDAAAGADKAKAPEKIESPPAPAAAPKAAAEPLPEGGEKE